MKHHTRFASSLALTIAAPLPLAAMAAEPCLAVAAGDYGTPTRIFEAMRAASAADVPSNPEMAAREFWKEKQ